MLVHVHIEIDREIDRRDQEKNHLGSSQHIFPHRYSIGFQLDRLRFLTSTGNPVKGGSLLPFQVRDCVQRCVGESPNSQSGQHH